MRIAITFLLFAGLWSPSQLRRQENSQVGFIQFIAEFSQRDSTQRDDVRFPLEYVEWHPGMDGETPDTTYLDESDWEPLNLHPVPEGTIIESTMGTYTQLYAMEETRAIVEIRGLDNGMHTNLVFERWKGRWRLVRIEEYST